MSSSRLKRSPGHRNPRSEKVPALDLAVDKESAAFKVVEDAYASGMRLDLTDMTDQELAEYVTGQA